MGKVRTHGKCKSSMTDASIKLSWEWSQAAVAAASYLTELFAILEPQKMLIDVF